MFWFALRARLFLRQGNLDFSDAPELPLPAFIGGLMAATAHSTGRYVGAYIDWKAGVWAGLIAGAVFLMLEMLMVWAFMSESPWAPPRMIAAMVLGEGILPQPNAPATFGFGIVMTALIIHFVLAAGYGLIGGALAHRFGFGGAIAVGVAFGLALYLINFYLIAAVLFPWFAMARNWISVFAHIVFGAVLGLAYVRMRKPRVP